MVIICGFVFFSCISCGRVVGSEIKNVVSGAFLGLKVEGNQLKNTQGEVVYLKGFAMQNGVYTLDTAPAPGSPYRYTEDDYTLLKQQGATAVRFYLQYDWLETAEKISSFYEYLDEQLDLAREKELYLILNLHYFGDSYYTGESVVSLVALKNFWKIISARYSKNEVIAGYDLLNEPFCSNTFTESRLYEVYENIIEELRASDDQHIIFLSDPVNAFDNREVSSSIFLTAPFKRVSDNNVVYEYHWYQPYAFTHQNAEFDNNAEFGVSFPFVSYHVNSILGWYELENQPKIANTDGVWVDFEGSWVSFNVNPLVSHFGISLFAGNSNGQVWFDDIRLEKRSNGIIEDLTDLIKNRSFAYRRRYLSNNNHSNQPANWYFISDRSGIQYGIDEQIDADGEGGAIFIDATSSSPGEYATWKSNSSGMVSQLFKIENDSEYRVKAKIRTIGNSIPDIYAGFELYDLEEEILDEDKLSLGLDVYKNWAEQEQVPLYCGEFGATDPGQFGLTNHPEIPEDQVRWLNFMGGYLRDNSQHWTYHAYKDYTKGGFGLFNPDAFSLRDVVTGFL